MLLMRDGFPLLTRLWWRGFCNFTNWFNYWQRREALTSLTVGTGSGGGGGGNMTGIWFTDFPIGVAKCKS